QRIVDRSTLELRTPHGLGRAPGRRQAATLVAALITVLLAGCTPLGPPDRSGGQHREALAPPASLAAVTAAPIGTISGEIGELAAFSDQVGARLRTAFLQQELGDWSEAETTLNGILFGTGEPGAEASAIA